MTNRLLTTGVWKSLSSAIGKARNPMHVAVAYLGQGANSLLPLPANSRLVVDASDHAVKNGQTCPADLKKLQKRGVIIYSAPNLHAKVYVFESFALIGSANVSSRSAGILVEAMLRTTDRSVIRSARSFVRGLCLHELTPGAIDRLHRIYQPPRFPIGVERGRATIRRNERPILPRLFLTQLENEEPPSASVPTQKAGMQIAKSRRKNRRAYVLDYFWWTGQCPIRISDKVVQVVNEGRGRRLIAPPANVIYRRTWRRANRRVTFIYIEHPNIRRIRMDKLARRLGRGAKKQLARTAFVRDRVFAEKLLSSWQRL